MEERKFAPILPFDGTLSDNFLIYDNVTYVCGIDRSSPDSPVKMHHDSMIKYYTYGYKTEPVRIGGDLDRVNDSDDIYGAENIDDERYYN